jgi:hypothetical protein
MTDDDEVFIDSILIQKGNKWLSEKNNYSKAFEAFLDIVNFFFA